MPLVLVSHAVHSRWHDPWSNTRAGPIGDLFADIAFEGDSFSGDSDVAFVGVDWNDRISSVQIPAGVKVTLFEHSDFGGASLTLTGNAADLRNYPGPGSDGTWNDAVSSIRLEYSNQQNAAYGLDTHRLEDTQWA